MTHRRARIRKAIAAAIATTDTLGDRVSTTRTRPTQAKELPCAIVYALREASGRATANSKTLTRDARVLIEIRLSKTDGLDDEADALTLEVESAMDADPTFGRLAIDSFLASTEIGLDGEGDEQQAVVTLEYAVVYRTDPGAAGT